MDQLPELQAAINSDPQHNFLGATYEIAGTLDLPDGAMVQNLKVLQLTPGVPCVKKIGGWIKGIDGLEIHRGSDPAAGSILIAGLHLQNTAVDEVIQSVDVTGDGKGLGIYFLDMHDFRLGRGINVHDMTYSCPSVSTEQMFGIWFSMSSGFHLKYASVDNLGGLVGSAARRTYQTDGITVSGSYDFSVCKTKVSRVGEGIDVTGSNGNRRFLLDGIEASDCDAFGVKLANSAGDAVVRNSVATRCGFSGFVISGPTHDGCARMDSIMVCDNQAIDTGNAYWASSHIAGFAILQGSHDLDYPRGVHFLRNLAHDTRATPQMKYGFRNDNGTVNRMANCTSIGHTISSVLGTFG